MKFNKFVLATALSLGCAAFTSCSDNDDPAPVPTETVSGFYTLNSGNQGGNIPASITAYNYLTGQTTQNAFFAENKQHIGDGAQQAIIYGSKMYIAMYQSNIIWVVNPKTLKIIDSIQPKGNATSPRALVAKDGKVYISMYTGYVSQLDTLSMKIERDIKVGPNPEQMAIAGNNLYVANSDGSNYMMEYANSYISIVNLSTFAETKIQDTSKALNPTDAKSNGTDVFFVCKGNYSTIPSTVKKIVGNDVQDVCLGTFIDVVGDELFVIDAPYAYHVDHSAYSFKVYSTKTLELLRENMVEQVEGTDSWVSSPSGFAVDPVSGDIVILSYQLDSSNISQYQLPTYANIYDKNGKFKKRIETGIGAISVTFSHELTVK